MAISQEFQQKLDLYSKPRSHTLCALRLRYFLWLLVDKGCNTAPAIEGTIWNSRVKLSNVRLSIKERKHTTETKRKSEDEGEPVNGMERAISTVRQATYVGQIWRRCLCPGDSCRGREETWENDTVVQVSLCSDQRLFTSMEPLDAKFSSYYFILYSSQESLFNQYLHFIIFASLKAPQQNMILVRNCRKHL